MSGYFRCSHRLDVGRKCGRKATWIVFNDKEERFATCDEHIKFCPDDLPQYPLNGREILYNKELEQLKRNPAVKKMIEESMQAIREGQVKSWSQVKKELNL